jgi:hypothetical protein
MAYAEIDSNGLSDMERCTHGRKEQMGDGVWQCCYCKMRLHPFPEDVYQQSNDFFNIKNTWKPKT